jgi:hypothetical protein
LKAGKRKKLPYTRLGEFTIERPAQICFLSNSKDDLTAQFATDTRNALPRRKAITPLRFAKALR